MAYLNDAVLWQAARSTLPPALRQRLELLHTRQQRAGLSFDEQAEAERLEQLYRDTLLVRAQAAVLLQQRGYDVTVAALKMNHEEIVAARRLWVEAGWHPPKE